MFCLRLDCFWICVWVLFSWCTAALTHAVDYVADIKPLLEEKCFACHGPLKAQSSLRIDTAKFMLQGGDSGAAVVPGKPDESLLLDVLTGDAGYQMPPENEGAPLTPEQIDKVREWIASGATAPPDEKPAEDPKTWWSYQPIERPDLPTVADTHGCLSPIDYFVQAGRESSGLPHAEPADRMTWLRRVYLDLIGLPPSRAELHNFLQDQHPAAYETVVDDLLSRPEYGQRWGRHWMDIWRYSDWYGSRGSNEIRYGQRHLWRWRDWIVHSLNDDAGYDQMVRQMLAADELEPQRPDELAATGYLGRNWYKFDRDVWLFDTVERTGEAFLGLTFRCCRCHDHKFDPITHKEYYEFRAFFEPHDVRVDPVSAGTSLEKDGDLGMVLSDGIPLVYDKPNAPPTYRFERGDSRYPDKSDPLQAGVPAALGGSLDVEAADLPVTVWYPMLRPDVRKTLLEKTAAAVTTAAQQLAQSRSDLSALEHSEAEVQQAAESGNANSQAAALPEAGEAIIDEDFSTQNSKLWKSQSGTWTFEEGKLLQNSPTHFATIVGDEVLPTDFALRLRYRTLAPGSLRSVGFSFDYQDAGNSQDVYTSVTDTGSTVQAFHRSGGKQSYPKAGIVATPLEVGQEIVLDVQAAGSMLTIDLNGERKLEYSMPLARRSGRFALWAHQGTVEFLGLKIHRITESEETKRQRLRDAHDAVSLAELKHHVAVAQHHSMVKRIDAEVAKYFRQFPDGAAIAESEVDAVTQQLAREASAASANVVAVEARLEIATGTASAEQLAKAEARLAEASEMAKDPTRDQYEPLGEQYPRTSTGRRRSLAEWITDRDNPRTARVAANHLWGRHFGQPLVATTENFGLNGRKPSHPELLDWLASELMRNDWRMKPLHRQIVLSATYRMASQTPAAMTEHAIAVDPENRLLWKMNARRMEAELVRDSALRLAARLDNTFDGPVINEDQGEVVFRRSLYFRNTPNEKMPLLEIFDVADPNACYRRQESIVPHQSLAMMNSSLSLDAARIITAKLCDEEDFINAAFETILSRNATPSEAQRCQDFLTKHAALLTQATAEKFSGSSNASQAASEDPIQRARENLIHVLLLHNDFVTIR
ncbi:PSD1 and planctomycete cytochrome C domain-containing protein [Roseimaritima multifibrata]|nr:PSD1 and planctomycete cytochrome C domain-containing protein [Roseimaritima multifibrata]